MKQMRNITGEQVFVFANFQKIKKSFILIYLSQFDNKKMRSELFFSIISTFFKAKFKGVFNRLYSYRGNLLRHDHNLFTNIDTQALLWH